MVETRLAFDLRTVPRICRSPCGTLSLRQTDRFGQVGW
jgi:hypothetical protein